MEVFKHFESKVLKAKECVVCGAVVMVGQAAGFKVTLNPDPIDVVQEIEQRKLNRPTYELYETVLGAEPIYRSEFVIKSQTRRKVLKIHKCERKQQ
jgi:hypothetical protein